MRELTIHRSDEWVIVMDFEVLLARLNSVATHISFVELPTRFS